jgi:hypothetical protein
MTRSFICLAAALALAAWLPGYDSRAVAQEQESADASADVAADEGTASGEISADASADAPPSDTEPQASTSGEEATQSESQTATTGDASSGQSSTDADATQDTSRDASATMPQPSNQRDVNARADADVDADADRTRTQSDRRSYETRRPVDRGTYDRDRRDSDRSVHRRHDRDARDGRDGRHDRDHGLRFGRGSDRGLTVFEIDRNSFFVRSGLRRGDVIISLDGRPIRSEADFHRHWGHFHGDRVPLIVLRDGRRQTIYVEYPQDVAYGERIYDNRRASAPAYLGVVFDANVRDAAVVHSIAPGSPAEDAGLQPGDMILELNGEEIMEYRDAIDLVRSMRPGDQLDIVFVRGRSEAETQAVLDARPVRTARVQERGILVQPRPAEVEIDVDDRDNDRRLFDRDRDDDGERDRGLLQRVFD